MKKYIQIVMVIATFGFSQNLLQNPGFENWTAGMPDHWEKESGIEIFQEDFIVHGGTYSVRESLITQTQDSADFFQGPIAVSPNTRYIYSIWIVDNDLRGRLRQWIRWYTNGDSSNYWSPSYSINSPGWQELTMDTLSPSHADSVLVCVRAYDSAAIWNGWAIFYIDDASFEAPSLQTPVINRVWHDPINPDHGVTENVYAWATDDGTIDYDTLYFGINNLASPTAITHTAISSDTFQYQIPDQSTGDTVFYYLLFIDDQGLQAFSDTHAYYVGVFGITINELYYDTPGTDLGCFIELYGSGDASLDGFTLVGVNGNDGTAYATIDLNGYSIPGDGFFVIGDDASVPHVDLIDADANLHNGPDNIELKFYNITIDALGYGDLNGWVFTGEWLPAPDVSGGHCLGRYPDGFDTDNNFDDFYNYGTQTPGEPNPAVGVRENNSSTARLPVIPNPVVSGIGCAHIITIDNSYPIMIYNVTGQMIKEVSKPEVKLDVPAGIYFLKLNNVEHDCAKIVVVR